MISLKLNSSLAQVRKYLDQFSQQTYVEIDHWTHLPESAGVTQEMLALKAHAYSDLCERHSPYRDLFKKEDLETIEGVFVEEEYSFYSLAEWEELPRRDMIMVKSVIHSGLETAPEIWLDLSHGTMNIGCQKDIALVEWRLAYTLGDDYEGDLESGYNVDFREHPWAGTLLEWAEEKLTEYRKRKTRASKRASAKKASKTAKTAQKTKKPVKKAAKKSGTKLAKKSSRRR